MCSRVGAAQLWQAGQDKADQPVMEGENRMSLRSFPFLREAGLSHLHFKQYAKPGVGVAGSGGRPPPRSMLEETAKRSQPVKDDRALPGRRLAAARRAVLDSLRRLRKWASKERRRDAVACGWNPAAAPLDGERLRRVAPAVGWSAAHALIAFSRRKPGSGIASATGPRLAPGRRGEGWRLSFPTSGEGRQLPHAISASHSSSLST